MDTPALDLSTLLPGRPPGDDHGAPIQIADDLAWLRCGIVNVAFLGHPDAGDRGWVLVDAGLPGFAGTIARAAEARFGGSRPAAIVLTHGHFDHVGALHDLADRWDTRIYAHQLELPYLTGKSAYPPPDPTVGGGLTALLSPLFPRSPVDVHDRLHPLPEDSSVPGMPGWRWVHVPGHSVGQVALWRDADRSLIAADAFVTTAQESAYAAVTQEPELHGPPKYFTHDWQAARDSVVRLAQLEPELVVTGHGRAMRGAAMREALHTLAQDFDRLAVPEHGRYVDAPQRAEDGTAYRR